MHDKKLLTEKLVSQLDLWAVGDAMKYWWQNPKSGWRLTAVGLDAFEQCQIERWEFDIENLLLSPTLLLALDRKLTGPYYIQVGKKSKLIFFNSKEATVFALYGDIKKFIHSLSNY